MEPRPVTYRMEIIGPILNSVAAGECCSVVGMSGVGKSNMVQHMLRPDVLQHHLGTSAETLRFITIDTNMLAEWSSWGFFEGLSEALLASFETTTLNDGTTELHDLHRQVLAAPGQTALALRLCSEILARLCTQWRLVILFDEFDPLFEQLAGVVLRNLRGLRDRHKYRLMYVTFSRQPLTILRDEADWDEIESFLELLTLRELGLQPLSETDTAMEIERFAGRHGRTVDVDAKSKIVTLSGGHPALLRALVQQEMLDARSVITAGEQSQQVPALRLECTKIWQQLIGDEQDDLLRVVRGTLHDHNRLYSLLLKGIVRPQNDKKVRIFSPLLGAYLTPMVAAGADDAPVPITIDLQRHTVIYYGHDITSKLPKLQMKLLEYLWEHFGQICSVEDVALVLYEDFANDMRRGEYFDKQGSLERMRVLARRLKYRLAELVPDQPVPFSIFQGRGYLLGTLAE